MAQGNVVSTEVVEFKAEGLDELIEKARQMGLTTEEATRKAEAAVYRVEQVAKRSAASVDSVTGGIRNRSGRSGRDSGLAAWQTDRGTDALARQAKEAQRMAAQFERSGDRWAEKLKAGVRSAVREAQRYGDQAGRGLGAARGGMGSIPGIGAAVGVGALWHKGFSGTVEANKMDREVELLGREVAGVFKPVTDAFTNLARDLRQWLERLSPQGQDHVAAATTVAAGSLVAGKAMQGNPVMLIPAVAAAIKMADNLEQFYQVARFASRQVRSEITGGRIDVSGEESKMFGYRGMTEEQRAKEEEKVNSLIEKHKDYTTSFRGHMRMIGGSSLKAFGYDPTNSGLTSYGEHFQLGSDLYKRRQELKDIKSGILSVDGPNENRRRVTADNISYGDVGSSYDEAVIGLMKVNTASSAESDSQKLDRIADYLGKITENTREKGVTERIVRLVQ